MSKWQRSQKLRELKEIKDFNFNVDVKGERNLSLSITWNICDSRCHLSHKGDHILISNWTRDVSKCVDKTRNTIYNSKITIVIQRCQVYCTYRLPDTRDVMVSCDDCHEWYHVSCLNLTQSPLAETWFCSSCLKKKPDVD